jgi:hypothetical protein
MVAPVCKACVDRDSGETQQIVPEQELNIYSEVPGWFSVMLGFERCRAVVQHLVDLAAFRLRYMEIGVVLGKEDGGVDGQQEDDRGNPENTFERPEENHSNFGGSASSLWRGLRLSEW